MSARTYWIVGPGRMGLAIGSTVAGAGLASQVRVIGHRESAPDHPLFDLPLTVYATGFEGPPGRDTAVLLAVPDRAIPDMVDAIGGLGPPGDGCAVLHFSGARGSEVLNGLGTAGYAIGSLHPLQSVADPGQGDRRLEGSYFTFEGEPGARTLAVSIVEAAHGTLLEVDASQKAGYHAACVFASNYMIACAAVAIRLLSESAGIPEEEARKALRPLWRGAVANLDEMGLPGALTGPISRGDLETVRAHLEALNGDVAGLYRKLGLEALRLGRMQGLEPGSAANIESALREGMAGS